MRIFPVCLALAIPAPTLADDCSARLSALLGTPLFDGQPYIAETATVSGGYAARFTQNWASLRHSLMVTHEPPGMPDSLQYEGGTYAPDGNGGWTLLYQSDPAQLEADIKAMQAAMAAAVTEATCGTEDRNGKTLDRLKGTLSNIPPYEGDVAVSYLVDPATGDVAEMDMAYRMAGIDNTVTFVLFPAPGLQLPVP